MTPTPYGYRLVMPRHRVALSDAAWLGVVWVLLALAGPVVRWAASFTWHLP